MKSRRSILTTMLAVAVAVPAISASAMQLVSEIPGRASTWESPGATLSVITGTTAADVMGRSSTLPSSEAIRAIEVRGDTIEFGRA